MRSPWWALFVVAALPTICSAAYVACRPGTFVTKRRGWGGVTEDNCFRCPAGKYTDRAGLTVCNPCVGANIAPRAGSPACVSCPAGKYIGPEQRERTQCHECPAGKHVQTVAARACAVCRAGSIARVAAARCYTCGGGTYAWRQGTSDNRCMPCPAGRFFSAAQHSAHIAARGVARCEHCPRGRVATTAGSTTCETCANGRYQPLRGGIKCDMCPQGKYQPRHYRQERIEGLASDVRNELVVEYKGEVACASCEAGRFSAVQSATRCQVCAPGRASAIGAVRCRACSAGHYARVRGTALMPGVRHCRRCPAGRIAPQPSATRCEACAVGRVSRTVMAALHATRGAAPRRSARGGTRCVDVSTAPSPAPTAPATPRQTRAPSPVPVPRTLSPSPRPTKSPTAAPTPQPTPYWMQWKRMRRGHGTRDAWACGAVLMHDVGSGRLNIPASLRGCLGWFVVMLDGSGEPSLTGGRPAYVLPNTNGNCGGQSRPVFLAYAQELGLWSVSKVAPGRAPFILLGSSSKEARSPEAVLPGSWHAVGQGVASERAIALPQLRATCVLDTASLTPAPAPTPVPTSVPVAATTPMPAPLPITQAYLALRGNTCLDSRRATLQHHAAAAVAAALDLLPAVGKVRVAPCSSSVACRAARSQGTVGAPHSKTQRPAEMCDATFVIQLVVWHKACSSKLVAATAPFCRRGGANAIFASPVFKTMVDMELHGDMRAVTLAVLRTNASVGDTAAYTGTELKAAMGHASASKPKPARNGDTMLRHAMSPILFLKLLCAPLVLLFSAWGCGSCAQGQDSQHLAVTSPAERATFYMMQHARVQQLQMVASAHKSGDMQVSGDPHNSQKTHEDEF